MREAHFLGDDTVIAEIVDHIFAPSNAKDRPDQRRIFVEGGLCHSAAWISCTHRVLRARRLKPSMGSDRRSFTSRSRIINRNLDRAVARTLSFSRRPRRRIDGAVAQALKTQGQELVLLVEEFARLQGIDRALLQAITSQGDERQCKMRTAIAVTTGFFQSVAETAYMHDSRCRYGPLRWPRGGAQRHAEFAQSVHVPLSQRGSPRT